MSNNNTTSKTTSNDNLTHSTRVQSIKPIKTIKKNDTTSTLSERKIKNTKNMLKRSKSSTDIILDEYFKDRKIENITPEKNDHVKLLNSDELSNLYNVIDAEKMFKESIDKRKFKYMNRKILYTVDKNNSQKLDNLLNDETSNKFNSIKKNNVKTKKRTSTEVSLIYQSKKLTPVDRLLNRLKKSLVDIDNDIITSRIITKSLINEMKTLDKDFNNTILIESINDKNKLVVNSQELIESMIIK